MIEDRKTPTLTTTPQLYQPSMSRTESQRKLESIKEFSLTFLGHGYDRSSSSPSDGLLPTRTLRVIPTDVDVSSGGNVDQFTVANNLDEASTKLKQKFGGKFNLDIPKFPLGGSAKYEKNSSRTEGTETIVFAASHIDSYECRLNKIPPLEGDLATVGPEVKGDSVVYKGYVYTGYKIFFKIQLKWDKTTGHSGPKVSGKAGYKIASVGSGLQKLREKIDNKKIVNIEIHGEGFGDYSVPLGQFESPKNLSEVQNIIRCVSADYVERVNDLATRAFFLDKEKCYLDYSSVTQKTTEASEVPTLDLTYLPDVEENYYELIKQICVSINPHLMTQLENVEVNPVLFLQSIVKIFSNIFSQNLEGTKSGESVLVAGLTGAGKSSFVGYMRDAKIKLGKIRKKNVAVYEVENRDLPGIGHLGSQTKGFSVFSPYIDTAGIFDTHGAEDRFCNAVAMKMAVTMYDPKRLILMISSSMFENRAIKFFELLERLERVVEDPTSKSSLSSILFVVNDHVRPRNKRDKLKHVKRKIKEARDILIDARDKLIPKKGWMDWLNNRTEEKLLEVLEGIDPERVERIGEYEQRIQILNEILESDDSIAVANIFEEETRQTIKEWLEKPHDLAFCMENLEPEGFESFKTLMRGVACYFNSLQKEKASNLELFDIFVEDIKRMNSELMRLNKNFDERNIKKQILIKRKMIEKNLKKLEDISSNLASKEALRKRKLEQQAEYLTSIEPKPWKDLVPNKTLKPRSLFDFSKCEYKYMYEDKEGKEIPVIDAKFNNPTHKGKSVGFFQEVKTFKQPDNILGAYTATYSPIRWGYKEVTDAKLSLIVATKDHPISIIMYNYLESQLNGSKGNNGLNAEIETLSSQKEKLKKDNEMLEKEIEELQENGESIRINQNRSKELEDELEKMKSKAREVAKGLRKVEATLQAYTNLCALTAKIIKNLDLLHLEDRSDSKIFTKFFYHFAI